MNMEKLLLGPPFGVIGNQWYLIMQAAFTLKVIDSLFFCFIAHCKNVRGLGKNMAVFHLFKKLRYLNKSSTKF